ncbi:MAG: extracellular solute-binding protein [Deltaproteobacteria bacterium]|nr:extracellular solute-binding protein [Deltaproteobacteria bacterium]
MILKSTLSRLFTAGVSLAFLLLATGASAAEELSLLTWEGYAPKELVEKFEKETKIKVNVTLSNNEEMIAKLRATRGGGFDLAQPSQDRISGPQKEYQIYQAIDMSQVKKELFVDSMLKATMANTMVGGKPFGLPHVWGTDGLIVNTAKAAGASDYSDLCDAKYAGRTSFRLKRPVLVAMAFSMGQNPFEAVKDKAAYEKLMNAVGDKLIACKKNVKTYYPNGDALLGLLRADEVTVAMGWDGGGWKLGKEKKEIQFLAPKSGAMGWVDTFAIPAKAKNLKAAYAWINFMMRPENSAVFTNQENYFTASKGAEKFVKADVAANYTKSFPPAAVDNIKWYPPIDTWAEKIEGDILEKVRAAGG